LLREAKLDICYSFVQCFLLFFFDRTNDPMSTVHRFNKLWLQPRQLLQPGRFAPALSVILKVPLVISVAKIISLQISRHFHTSSLQQVFKH